MKRLFDVIASLVALVVLSPLFLLCVVLVWLSSEGPVFYRGERVGCGGTVFRILKFRTMYVNAGGPSITHGDDPRVTRIGRVLRRFKLDELPQLLNVLLGEMSIVGPRPEAPAYVRLYSPDERRVLSVRPGITSPASVRHCDEAAILTGEDWHERYVTEIMPGKLRDDLRYIDQQSFLTDLQVICRTFTILYKR